MTDQDGSRLELLRAGRLLVANPLLREPNFDRTVVLLIAYGAEGALGLVLNRPSRMDVASPLPQWQHLAAEPAVLFFGGPVQHQAVICLARGEEDPSGGWKPVTADVGTLDLDLDPARVAGTVSQLRLFAGYAGWAGGQLEAEIESGGWWVVDALPDDPFVADPDRLWKRVLLRQQGALRFVAHFPDDPAHQ